MFGNIKYFYYICALTINKMENHELELELAIIRAIMNNTDKIDIKPINNEI